MMLVTAVVLVVSFMILSALRNVVTAVLHLADTTRAAEQRLALAIGQVASQAEDVCDEIGKVVAALEGLQNDPGTPDGYCRECSHAIAKHRQEWNTHMWVCVDCRHERSSGEWHEPAAPRRSDLSRIAAALEQLAARGSTT